MYLYIAIFLNPHPLGPPLSRIDSQCYTHLPHIAPCPYPNFGCADIPNAFHARLRVRFATTEDVLPPLLFLLKASHDSYPREVSPSFFLLES